MKIANRVIEATRKELHDFKNNASKRERDERASRFWDEGISLAKSGKTGAASVAFNDAAFIAGTSKAIKEFSKWDKAAREALVGKPKKLNKLLDNI